MLLKMHPPELLSAREAIHQNFMLLKMDLPKVPVRQKILFILPRPIYTLSANLTHNLVVVHLLVQSKQKHIIVQITI